MAQKDTERRVRIGRIAKYIDRLEWLGNMKHPLNGDPKTYRQIANEMKREFNLEDEKK